MSDTTKGISLEELYNHLTEDEGKAVRSLESAPIDGEQTMKTAVDTEYGEIIKTSVDDGMDYYDFCNKDGTLACADGEAVEVVETKNDCITLFNEESGDTFKLSTDEYNTAVFDDKEQALDPCE